MNIYYPNKPDIDEASYEILKEMGVFFCGPVQDTVDDVRAKLSDCEVLFSNYLTIDKNKLETLKKLKHIITPSSGYDWVDVSSANLLDITVSNCPTFSTISVAEHAVALILDLYRNLNQKKYDSDSRMFELTGKTIGLLGYGRVAKRIEMLLSGFCVRVLFIDSVSTDAEIDMLLKTSDIVISTLPSSKKTYNFMSKNRFSLMKDDSMFVNISRGDIVDEDALLDVLISKKLIGAGLDVVKAKGGSGRQRVLLDIPQVIFTPHIAYMSQESLKRKGDEIIFVLGSCLNAQPVNVITS